MRKILAVLVVAVFAVACGGATDDNKLGRMSTMDETTETSDDDVSDENASDGDDDMPEEEVGSNEGDDSSPKLNPSPEDPSVEEESVEEPECEEPQFGDLQVGEPCDGRDIVCDCGLICVDDVCTPKTETSAEEGTSLSEETAEIPQLFVTPVRGIPADGIVYLDSVHEPRFCFTLEARGGRFQVTPPLIHIEPLDGGSATTASKTGVVFPSPSLEGEEVLYGPTKVSPLESGGVSPWTWRDSGGVTLESGSEQTFCVYTDVTDWSETLEDFFNKTFRVVMDEWVPEDAVLLEPDGAERLFSDTQHIVSPDAILGDPFIVTSPDGEPPDRYTGTLELLPDELPLPTDLFAGQEGAPLFAFRLRADGTGGCVREITLRADPDALAAQTFSRIYVGHADGELLHGRDIYLGAGIDRWGFPDAPSFCVEGGEEVRYLFYADVFESAPPGAYDIWIEPTDIYRFSGEVVGEVVRSTVTVTD